MTNVLITWWKDKSSARVARLCCFFAVCTIYMENKVTHLPGSPCLLAWVTLLD